MTFGTKVMQNHQKWWKTWNWAKVIKNEKFKNSKNVKIEMRLFRKLSEPQRSKKKCSEQLRSSSIDGSCQMVRTVAIKLKKGQYVFGFQDQLTTCYCWRLIWSCFSVRVGSEKLNFALKNWFSSKFLSKTFFCHSWQFLWKLRFAQKWRKK